MVASRPRIAVTIGDPAGIGPEIVLKTIAESSVLEACVPIIIADAQELAHQARRLDLVCGLPIFNVGEDIPADIDGPVIYNIPNLPEPVEIGVETGVCGKAAGDYIVAAVDLCRSGQADAMATAPLNKKALFLGGYSYPGHTEFLADLTKVEDYAMAFVAPGLRVVLLTTHMPLAEAIRSVRKPDIEQKIRLTHHELMRWGIVNDGIEVSGPYSADTIFLRAARGEFDAVISCYHDQGLIAVKCLSFGEAINVTIGLPFIRTSVDHGTAFDIAGKGVAEHSSMVAAVLLAAELVRHEHSGEAVER